MTPLEHLWNGWRTAYVRSGGREGSRPELAATDPSRSSVFSRMFDSGLSDDELNIVHRGSLVAVLLNAFPYSTGHALVLPYRQVDSLEELTADEAAELWQTTTRTVIAVKAGLQPEGVNVGINLGRPAGGSIVEHLHVHVVPRWTGDANFMTAVANTRTLPEALADTAARLRAAWPA